MAPPSPATRVRRLPSTSNTADSLVALISLTPSGVTCPAESVCVLPPLIFTTAFPEVSAMTWISAAAARQGAHRRRTKPIALRWSRTPFSRKEALVPEVLELQRDIGHRFPHQRDRFLEHVLLGAGDPDRVALDAALHLELAVLDELDHAFRALLLDAFAHLDGLLHLVAAHRLHLARLERADVHAALGKLAGEHVAHLAQLELVVGVDGERLFLFVDLDARIRALEVEAVGDLLVALVHGVADLDVVHLGHDVE